MPPTVKNREFPDGRWDKHDTKDTSNVADLSNAGFLGNRFLNGCPKIGFDEESPVRKVEAFDLVAYNSGPLTELVTLDKGC